MFVLMSKHSVYILSGLAYGPVFIGSAGDLSIRLYQHRCGKVSHMASRIDRLIYVEPYDCAFKAATRARALRTASRQWLDALIASQNPAWLDLSGQDQPFAPIEEAQAA
jgi:predicted GIY-YIG superfamily endonuclease